MDFFPEIPMNEQQAQAIARGLYTVAAVDGIHEREAALIATFYGTTANSLAELERLGPLSPTDLAAALSGEELRQLFVKAALLLAYADGKVTSPERAQITIYSTALGVSPDRLAALEESVRDHLMQPLSRLANSEAVGKVAKQLGR
jgi:tellurite resistance protein